MQKKPKDRPKQISSAAMLLLVVVSVILFTLGFSREMPAREIAYGTLLQMTLAEDPQARFVTVRMRANTEVNGEIQVSDPISDGSLKITRPNEAKFFHTRINLPLDGTLANTLWQRAGSGLVVEPEDPVGRILVFLTPLLGLGLALMFGFLVLRWVSGGSGPFSFGRSRHKMYAQEDSKITFEDVAGIDEAVAELREIVDFLKTPEKYQALGGRIPKGVLLVGPPGTGKTLLAKAVAGEADAPFFSLSGSDFVEMFVGVGASRVRDLFGQAVQRAPSIIFIDELDALGKTRSGSALGSHDEREQTLNALLVEMDGFEGNRAVIIMAATNRPETLDPALLRPGRFDRTVVVDRPDLSGREAILKVHVRNVKVAEDVDLRHVASLTPGTAGADLANIVNEAALLAARKNQDSVHMADFNEAIERGAIGLERKSRIMTPEEKKRVAYHEAGHALVASTIKNTHPVHKVTIVPRGIGALGYVLQRPEDDRHMQTRGELESDIKVALGGTVAEELVFDEIANGATSDLRHANAIARRMVKEFGMSQLGKIYFREGGENPFLKGSGWLEGGREYSEKTAREIDMEVRHIMDNAMAEVQRVIRDQRDVLDRIAHRLIEKEVIDGAELRRMIERPNGTQVADSAISPPADSAPLPDGSVNGEATTPEAPTGI